MVRGDPGEFEFSAPPVRDPVYKGFSDKLGAVFEGFELAPDDFDPQ